MATCPPIVELASCGILRSTVNGFCSASGASLLVGVLRRQSPAAFKCTLLLLEQVARGPGSHLMRGPGRNKALTPVLVASSVVANDKKKERNQKSDASNTRRRQGLEPNQQRQTQRHDQHINFPDSLHDRAHVAW